MVHLVLKERGLGPWLYTLTERIMSGGSCHGDGSADLHLRFRSSSESLLISLGWHIAVLFENIRSVHGQKHAQAVRTRKLKTIPNMQRTVTHSRSAVAFVSLRRVSRGSMPAKYKKVGSSKPHPFWSKQPKSISREGPDILSVRN